MKIRFFALIIFLVILISGCSGKYKFNALPNLTQEKNGLLTKSDSVKTIDVNGFITVTDGLDKIIDRRISLQVERRLTLNQVFELLTKQGLNVLYKVEKIEPKIKSKKDDEEKKEAETIYISDYSGSLKNLLKRLQLTYGLFYDYQDNVLIVKNKGLIYVKVLMPGMQEELIKVLKSFDIQNAFYDSISSRIVFTGDYYQYKKIHDYFKQNDYLTLVNFDIMILENEYEKGLKYGIDWSKLNSVFQKDKKSMIQLGVNSDQNGSYLISFDIDGLNLQNVYSNLRKVTNYKVVQSANISTLNSKACILDVSEKVPYVAEINFLSQNNKDEYLQSYKFDTALSGLLIDITPNYTSGLLTLNFKAQIQSISDFLDVGVKNKVSQPVLSVRNFTNQIVIQPGRVQLIGGLTYKKGSSVRKGFIGRKNTYKSNDDRLLSVSVLLRADIVKYKFI